jgi:hypothetical protein
MSNSLGVWTLGGSDRLHARVLDVEPFRAASIWRSRNPECLKASPSATWPSVSLGLFPAALASALLSDSFGAKSRKHMASETLVSLHCLL